MMRARLSRLAMVGGVGVVLAGCANNVSQDRSTGPDGKLKGAAPLVFAEGEAKAKGIVTYPGGDRVDWKLIELPEGVKGRLDLQMTYTTPRPGLKVSFDVFDQWNTPVTPAVSGGRGRIRSTTIDAARGTYFVRVYAPRRGDAGTYKLTAEFKADPPPLGPVEFEVLPPPKLPAVPPPPSTCEVHDPTDPVCATLCALGAPATWKGCTSPTPPPPPPVTTATVTPPVTTAPPAQPFTTRAMKSEVLTDELELTLAGGSANGVTKDWKANLLRGDTTSLLPGGTARIIRVNKTTTIVRIKTTSNVIAANPNVQLTP